MRRIGKYPAHASFTPQKPISRACEHSLDEVQAWLQRQNPAGEHLPQYEMAPKFSGGDEIAWVNTGLREMSQALEGKT